ncbi:ICE2-domain-containing protein [Auriculariales sp. MPI-PUGE-AT-0066]|nr:ICE2-domain-containing protein [Auriculariales sp. MPI-PUGE-AT-0066]
MLIWRALRRGAALWNVGQILLFLPLTLSTQNRPAFLALSLLLTVQSFIHCSLLLVTNGWFALSFLQVPVHPFLLLLCLNLFSAKDSHPYLNMAVSWWGKILGWSSPAFFIFEALSSLIVVQSLGRYGRRLIDRDESWQIGLLIASAAAYVTAAWWIVTSYPWTATTPLSSTLLGVAVSSFVFLSLIGFTLRRTNIIESSGMALFLAYNVWLCADTSNLHLNEWPAFTTTYVPLLDNVLPHLQTVVSFFTTAIPKPTLIALFYRLTILHFAARILPTIGDDYWDNEGGVDGGWNDRPSSQLTSVILTYRQTIFTTVYSHLLLLDHSQQVWWRWASVIFTLVMWGLELAVSPEDDDLD